MHYVFKQSDNIQNYKTKNHLILESSEDAFYPVVSNIQARFNSFYKIKNHI